MIYKIITCLSIIAVSANGNEEKPKHAISSQSFHREDVPLSYQFHNVHNYKPRHLSKDEYEEKEHNPKTVQYHSIQYAPLVPVRRPGYKETNNVKEQDLTHLLPRPNKEPYLQETNLEDRPKYNLEPKPLREDEARHQQNYRSFISGHNLQVFPQTTGQYEYRHVNPFPGPRLTQNPQLQNPGKVVYYHKTSTEVPETIPTHLAIEIQKPTMDYKLHQFAPSSLDLVKPVEVKPPVPNVLLTNMNSPAQNNQHANPYNHQLLHNQLFREKQQQTLQHPRNILHLNIARIYSIANQLQEAHLPPILLPKTHQQTNYGKPLPVINLANSVPTNILGKQQALAVALNTLPANSGKQPIYGPFNPAPVNNLGVSPNLSPAFYLQKHQENTLMLPVRNLHT